MEQSLYESIVSALDAEGALPEDFELLKSSAPSAGMTPVDGALDGAAVYHFGLSAPSEEDLSLMEKFLVCAGKGEFEEADKHLIRLYTRQRALNMADPLRNYINAHKEDLDPGSLFDYAFHTAKESTSTEFVKTGLSILSLFDTDDEDCRPLVINLALCDEFTFFSLFLIRGWSDADDVMWYLYPRLRGWGKIHLVEKINAAKAEQKDELLKTGIRNTISPAYSALPVFRKCGAKERIEEGAKEEERDLLFEILAALAENDPAHGIERIHDPGDLLEKLLSAYPEEHPFTAEQLQTLYTFRSYASDRIDAILKKESSRKTIAEAAEKGKSLLLAQELGIDIKKPLWRFMKKDFLNYSGYCSLLIHDPAYTDRVLKLFREKLAELEKAGGDRNDLSRAFLTLIIGELAEHPLKGTDMVRSALRSPFAELKQEALKTLERWLVLSEKPLSELSMPLYEEVLNLSAYKDDPVISGQASALLPKN